MPHISCLLINCFSLSRLILDKLYRGLASIAIASIIFVVRVEGESLWPVLVPGRRYLASRWGVLRIGDFAVFRNPKEKQEIFVKRVAGTGPGGYIMESTVSWGASSRDFGPVPHELILGKIYGAKN